MRYEETQHGPENMITVLYKGEWASGMASFTSEFE